MFYLLDPEKWERQKHFEYYMQMIPCGYTVTVRLDVENLYQQVKKCGLKFYPAFIYCTGKVVNEKREFKMGVDQEGRPGYFDVMHPNFTIFHKDDHTFSDIWSYYDDDFQTCYQNIINDMETYKDVKGPKGKEGQPPNFFCISCGWISQATAHGCQPEDQIYFRSLHLENMWKKRAEESCLLL